MVSVETALGFLSRDIPGGCVGRQAGCKRTEHLPTCCVSGSSQELGWRDVGAVR